MVLATERAGYFLTRPLPARIAIIDPQTMQPQIIPAVYYWDGREIWICCRNDIHPSWALELGKQCTIVMEEPEGKQNVRGLLMDGQAVLVSEPDWLTEKICGAILQKYQDQPLEQIQQIVDSIQNCGCLLFRMLPLESYTW